MFRHVIKEQLRVPAKIDYLGALRDFVSKVGHKHGYSERVINAFKLSIDEAATNIIKHAYRDWDGDITIRALIKKNSLTIILLDQGKFFDPRQVSEPDLKRYVDIGKKGGLGIFIMRRLLDDINYRKTEEGNELRLVKFRDVARKRKLVVPTIPVSLKARYWLVANSIFTVLVVSYFVYSYSQGDSKILEGFIERGNLACSALATGTARTLSTYTDDPANELTKQELLTMVTRERWDQGLYTAVNGPMADALMSKHRNIIYRAYLVSVNNQIIAASDSTLFLEEFNLPSNAEELQQNVYLLTSDSTETLIDIVSPVLHTTDLVKLCEAHIFVNKDEIDRDIATFRRNKISLVVLVWLFGSAGLFLLVYIVMNPFRRLAEWVRVLSQPGVEDEMDIDVSTEVGEIAQAFSDITTKLRKSQENLAEQERLQKEMQVAQEIQQTLLPTEFPEIEGYEIASFYEAAKEVGGDYYDFVEVDKDTLGIVVADVSGKGVPGSLVMTMIRTALRTEARGIKSASEVLARVNDFVVNDMKKGMFVTLFYVIIDSKRRRLNYASAGHNPMILYRGGTKQTYYLNPRGFPIGISLPDKDLFRKSIESDTIQLAEDDILIVYTDGITEAMNPNRKLFGEERHLKVIRDYGSYQAEPFVEKLREEINSFTEGYIQSDDITLVAIREKTSAEKIELGRAKKAHQMILQGRPIRDACEKAGLSTYAYYNKYKEVFEQEGIEGYEVEDDAVRVEANHLSIEEKTKIYDIIRLHPEYGAKRISEELSTEHYANTKISVSKIYEELVRSRLNTRELREAFVKSGKRKRRRFKPPGTPLLTLDGQIIFHRDTTEPESYEEYEEVEEPSVETTPKHEPTVHDETDAEEKTAVAEAGEKEFFETERILSEDIVDSALEEEEFEYTSDSESLTEGEDSPLLAQSSEDIEKEKLRETIVDEETRPVIDERVTDMEELDVFEYASSPDEADVDEATEVSELEIDRDSRLFDKIDSEELDVARLIESDDGLESPKVEQDEADLHYIEPTSEEIVKEYAGADLAESDIEDGEVVDQLESNGYDFGLELSEPFDEFLEIEEEQGLISSEGEVDVPLSNQFIDELDSFLEDAVLDFQDDEPEMDAQEIESVESPEEYQPNGEDEEKMSFAELMDFLDEGSFSMSDNGEDSEKPEVEINAKTSNLDISFPEKEPDSFIIEHVANGSDSHLTQDKEKILCQQRMDQALQLYESEDYSGAAREAEAIINSFPNFEAAHTIAGHSYFRLEKYKQAAKAYKKAKELDPRDVTARENLGVIYASQGDLHAAIKEWEQLLEIDPGRSDIHDSIERARRFLGSE